MTRPITGWSIQASCPHCGGPFTHLADGRPDGFTSRAVARCTGECGRTYVVQITLAHVPELGHSPRHKPDCSCARCTRGRATHCPQGHPYDNTNTYRTPHGTRECRTCRSDRRARAEGAA